MNAMHNVFPTSSNTASSLTSVSQNSTSGGGATTTSASNISSGSTQNKSGGTAGNYANYESKQPISSTTYGGMFSTGSKSPTNATTNKEPNKYAQYIPREIPLRSNNLNPTSKMEGSNPYNSEQIKRKEINIGTNATDINFMMKNKFTPTNNMGPSGGMGGIGTSSKLGGPTLDLKKPTETYTTSIKPTSSKPGITYTTTTSAKPFGRK